LDHFAETCSAMAELRSFPKINGHVEHQSESGEDSVDSSIENEHENEFSRKRRSCILLTTIVFMFVFAHAMVGVATGSWRIDEDFKSAKNATAWKFPPSVGIDDLEMSGLLGMEYEQKYVACDLVYIAFGAVILSCLTSSAVATYKPSLLPTDFKMKGTLSNVSQDASQPHGRMFTVALFTAALLLIMSRYTVWLYRPWIPDLKLAENPFAFSTLSANEERMWRGLWLVVPQVGFMLTAAIPSLSNQNGEAGEGLYWVLTLVHNVAAPFSMAFAVTMETVQLSHGEHAFAYFFSGEDVTEVYGPLSNFQRLRVIVLMYTWICGGIFLGIQIYLGAGEVLKLPIRTSNTLALVSFYAEVFGMCLAFMLPAIMAAEQTAWLAQTPVPMVQAQRAVDYIARHSARGKLPNHLVP